MIGQFPAVVAAVKLRWRLGLLLVAVVPLLWTYLVEYRLDVHA
jgi:hypothetical protein